MKGRSGFGTAFAKNLENDFKGMGENPLGGQLDCWFTQIFYSLPVPRITLAEHYIKETIRCDIIRREGVYIVSACRRTPLTKWFEKWTKSFTCLGPRELIAIHVRRG